MQGLENEGFRVSEVILEADLRLVEKLAEDIWTEHYTPIIGSDQVSYMLKNFQSVTAMREQIKDGMVYYLIFNSSEAIGYLAIKKNVDEIFLSKIYILADKRGQGFGKEAMTFVESMTRDLNFNVLSLTVNKNNNIALRAYEKLGFVNHGPLETDIGEGYIMDDFLMRKVLDHD